MAPAAPSSAKKQQSLTSFFSQKAVTSSVKSSQARTASNAAAADSPSRKRPLEEDDDAANEGPGRSAKKAKGDAPDVEKSAFFSKTSPLPAATSRIGDSSPSARAERFRYGSSATEPAGDDVDQDGLATKRRHEELHKRFVKKLGNPEALASRRMAQQEDTADAADDDDGDADPDEAESQAQAASKTKKKGAKSGKLTPMELQYLDIKRKHLDTILIVEVGYKFRFFGEDARIAAKVLSIVCIPGKMRYDEREFPKPRFSSPAISNSKLQIRRRRTWTVSPQPAFPYTACQSMPSGSLLLGTRLASCAKSRRPH